MLFPARLIKLTSLNFAVCENYNASRENRERERERERERMQKNIPPLRVRARAARFSVLGELYSAFCRAHRGELHRAQRGCGSCRCQTQDYPFFSVRCRLERPCFTKLPRRSAVCHFRHVTPPTTQNWLSVGGESLFHVTMRVHAPYFSPGECVRAGIRRFYVTTC